MNVKVEIVNRFGVYSWILWSEVNIGRNIKILTYNQKTIDDTLFSTFHQLMYPKQNCQGSCHCGQIFFHRPIPSNIKIKNVYWEINLENIADQKISLSP